MLYVTLLKTALQSLYQHKTRSLLTMLGIIIGIAAIVTTLSIGYGTQAKLKKQIAAIGNNYIEVWQRHPHQTDGIIKPNNQKVKPITVKDVQAIQQQCSYIRHLSPFVNDHSTTKYLTTSIISDIKSGNEQLLHTMGRKIRHGQLFTKHHIQSNSRVAILGAQAAHDLFKKANPIGKIIKIKNVPFAVIGILKPIENYMGMRNPNLDIIIPFTTAKHHIYYTKSINVHGIIASATSTESVAKAVREIKKILRSRHNLTGSDPDDFVIIDQESMFKAAHEASNTFNLFLLIIASISLLIGGIGVMNIMLVAVSERTTEIGVRMALGAPTKMILLQFLVEAVTLCFIGGCIGIVCGILTPWLLQQFLPLPAIIHPTSIFFAYLTIIIIGIIFGFYPAYQASRLNPVEALTKQ